MRTCSVDCRPCREGAIQTSWTARPASTQPKWTSQEDSRRVPSALWATAVPSHDPTNWPYSIIFDARSPAGPPAERFTQKQVVVHDDLRTTEHHRRAGTPARLSESCTALWGHGAPWGVRPILYSPRSERRGVGGDRHQVLLAQSCNDRLHELRPLLRCARRAGCRRAGARCSWASGRRERAPGRGPSIPAPWQMAQGSRLARAVRGDQCLAFLGCCRPVRRRRNRKPSRAVRCVRDPPAFR